MAGTNTKDFFDKYRDGKLRQIAGKEPLPAEGEETTEAVSEPAAAPIQVTKGHKYKVKGDTVEESDAEGNVVAVHDAAFKKQLEEQVRAGKARKATPAMEEPVAATATVPRPASKGLTALQSELLGADPAIVSEELRQVRKGATANDYAIDEKGRQAILNEVSSSQQLLGNDALDLFAKAPPYMIGALKSLGVEAEDFTKRLVNGAVGTEELQKYADIRMDALEAEKQAEMSSYNFKTKPNVMPHGVSFETVQTEDSKRKEIEDKYAKKAQNINRAVNNMAIVKTVNNEVYDKGVDPATLDPYAVGLSVLEITDPLTARKYKKKLDEGVTDEVERYKIGFVGNQAMQFAGMNAIANDDYITGKKLIDKTEGFTRKLLDENPGFKQEQLKTVLAQDIYKNQETWYSQITGTRVTKEDIIESAKRLGIPESEVANLSPEDIKRQPNALAQIEGSALRTGIAPVYEWWQRHFVNPVNQYIDPKNHKTDAQLDEEFKEGWFDNSWFGRKFEGTAPDVALSSGSRVISTDYKSPDYLTDIGTKDGKYNLNSIMNLMLDGTGQVAGYMGGGLATKGITGLSTASSMMTHMYITGYDRNKRTAAQYIPGDTDVDEAKRIALANIYTGAEILAERAILPIEKMNIFSSDAGKKLIAKVQKEGVEAIDKTSLAKFGKDFVLQTGKESGKEGLEEAATVYGQALGDMFFAPERFANAEYNQEAVEAGITGAISSLIPAGSGAMRHVMQQGPMRDAVMYNVGLNPDKYISQVQADVDANKISSQDGTEKIAAIQRISEIVNKRVPQQSPVTGRQLSEDDKITYANSLNDEAILKEQKEVAQDEVQAQAIDKIIEQKQAERVEILNKPEEALGVTADMFAEEVPPTVTSGEPVVVPQAGDGSLTMERLRELPDYSKLELPELVSLADKMKSGATEFSEEELKLQAKYPKEIDYLLKTTASGAVVQESPAQTTTAQEPQPQPQSTQDYFQLTETEVEESAKVGDNVKQKFAEAPKLVGRKRTMTLADGSSLSGRYILTDAFSVTPSHNPNTFTTNEGIPLLDNGRNPNDRDYAKEDNKKSVIKRARKYDGRALTDAPFVDKNGVVISGNDRTMSSQLAAENNTDQAYIAALKEDPEFYGFHVDMVDYMIDQGLHPRVVFVPDNILPYTTKTYSKFNPEEGGMKAKSQFEDIITKGRTLTDTFVESVGRMLEEFDNMTEFFKRIIPQREIAGKLREGGLLTQDNIQKYFNEKTGFTEAGKKLVQNVLMSKMLSEDALEIVQEYPGMIEKLLKNIVTINSIPPVDGVKMGDVISEAILLYKAVEEYMVATEIPLSERSKGLDLYMSQQVLDFGGDSYKTAAAAMFYEVLGRNQREFKKYLVEFKALAESGISGGLFGETKSVVEILQEAQLILDKYETKKEPDRREEGLQGDGDTVATDTGQPNEGQFEGDVQENAEQPAEQEESEAGDVVETQEPEPTLTPEPPPTPVAEQAPYVFGAIQADFIDATASAVTEPQRKTAEEREEEAAIAEYNKYLGYIAAKEDKMLELRRLNKEATQEYTNAFAMKKAYVQKLQVAKKKVDAINRKAIKEKADKVRALKVEDGPTGMVMSASPFAALLQVAKVVGVKTYNLGVEVVATSIELGYDLKTAIQRGIDYINEHYKDKWPEPTFREAFDQKGANKEWVRSMQMISTTLSDKQQAAAEMLVDGVVDGRATFDTVVSMVNGWEQLPEATRQEIISYVGRRVEGERMRNEAREKNRKLREEERTAEQQVEDKIQVETEANSRVDTGTSGYDFLRDFTMRADEETRKFVSGKTIADIFGETPEGNQDYHVAKVTDMLDDGDRMIEMAKMQFGDDVMVYGPKLLNYVKNDMVEDPVKKAVLLATFIGKLQDAKLREPARARQINMLLQQTYGQWQEFIRKSALTLNAARILRMYRDKQMADLFTDRIFTEAQRKVKEKMERAQAETNIPDSVAEKGPTNKASTKEIEAEAEAKKQRASRKKKKATKKDGSEYKQTLDDLKKKHGDKKAVLSKLRDVINKIKC